jgi:hypothetical protein
VVQTWTYNSGNTVRELVEVNRRLYSNEVLGLFHLNANPPEQPAADSKPMDPPFMSHPSDDFETVVDAMADAI